MIVLILFYKIISKVTIPKYLLDILITNRISLRKQILDLILNLFNVILHVVTHIITNPELKTFDIIYMEYLFKLLFGHLEFLQRIMNLIQIVIFMNRLTNSVLVIVILILK